MKFSGILTWLKIKEKKKEEEKERVIRVGDSEFNRSFNYADNIISTSKYSVFTFLPKNLFEQFQRIANAYFLGLLILQLIPQISSLTPITTVIPLVCVLSLTALKDGVDDIRRHHNDKIVNNRESFVLRNGEISDEKWRKVQVGDILKLTNDQFVAADLLLISSSEPNGLCYIETAELDGETNLKCKQALPDTANLEDDLREMENFNAEITCEPPNNRLNKFEGTITWNGKTLPLDNDKILLRGCVLRNTKWCYGVVIFAGKDTKLMQNSGKDTFKRTSIDRLVNVLIIGIFIFLLSICLFTAIAHGIWQGRIGIYFRVVLPWASFIPPHRVFSGVVAISSLTFLSYLILLNTLVPISLYVSVEMIRIAHSFWINWDIKMYDPKSNTPAKARTTTLNEELGQIQYIFSDKTGTLTQNIMVFKKCSIMGLLYGYVEDENGNLLSPTERDKCVDLSANPYYEPKFRFQDQKLVDKIRAGESHTTKFFTLLALCHTIMPGEKDGKLEYLAQSPDEGALVSAARNFGLVFISRTPNTITISDRGKEVRYELLAILDFNNVRKRMSVVVRKDKKITLFCKGADSVIMERLDPSDPQNLVSTTLDHLTKFAVEGLRTLCLAYKDIHPSMFKAWEVKYNRTNACLKDREAKLDELYEELEQNLHLLGATAIEDKLQDGVPETIANLLRAGIRIWVLTGDKQETAINVGYSCQLLNDDVEEIYVIDGQEFSEVQRELECVRKTAFSYPGSPVMDPRMNNNEMSANVIISNSPAHIDMREVGSPLSSSSTEYTGKRQSWISRLFCRSCGNSANQKYSSSHGGSSYQKHIPIDAQWEEWNDRIRRNFYWLIAPPSYNYNYNAIDTTAITNRNSNHNNIINPGNNPRATPAPSNSTLATTANGLRNFATNANNNNNNNNYAPNLNNDRNQAITSTRSIPLNLGALNSNNNNSNVIVSSTNPATKSGPPAGSPSILNVLGLGISSTAGGASYRTVTLKHYQGKGLQQPEIENMRIDVRVTPPHTTNNSLNYKAFNINNNNNNNSTDNINNSKNKKPNINNGMPLDNLDSNIPLSASAGRSLTVPSPSPLLSTMTTTSTGDNASLLTLTPPVGLGLVGRKSPSPYETKLRYPSKQSGFSTPSTPTTGLTPTQKPKMATSNQHRGAGLTNGRGDQTNNRNKAATTSRTKKGHHLSPKAKGHQNNKTVIASSQKSNIEPSTSSSLHLSSSPTLSNSASSNPNSSPATVHRPISFISTANESSLTNSPTHPNPGTAHTLKMIEVFTFDRVPASGKLQMIESFEPRYEPAQHPPGDSQSSDLTTPMESPPPTATKVRVIPVDQILAGLPSGPAPLAQPTTTATLTSTDQGSSGNSTNDNTIAPNLDFDSNHEVDEMEEEEEEEDLNLGLPPGANVNQNDRGPSPGDDQRGVANVAAPSPNNMMYDKPSIFALVISGHSLVHALDPRLESEFIELGSAAMAVICCRVTPLQKANVVDVVRRHRGATTLAIGDGANDVSMIRKANIGIGISGLEGRQAVLASDFAIAQFKFLERLILVHGRWSYYRMTKFLRYFFYKNFAFTLCSFWYGFFCGFSAQSLFDPWFISFYNLFYTSLPVLALAFFEQDVDEEMCIRYPQLYRASLGNKLFNKKIFAQSILHGIITSFILFLIPYFAFEDGMSSQGKETGLFVYGIVVSTCLIFTVSLQAGLDTTYWTGFNHFVIWGSIIFYLAMHFLMYSPIFNRTYVGVMLAATGQPKFWFTILLTVAVLILPVLALRSFFCDTRPNLADRIRYAQRIYNAKRRQKAKMAEKEQQKAAKCTAGGKFQVSAIQTISKFPFLPFPPPNYYDFLSLSQRPRGSIGRPLSGSKRASLRTGYAFAHQQGFGDLIIKGTSFRPLRGSFSDALEENPNSRTPPDDNLKTSKSHTSTAPKSPKSRSYDYTSAANNNKNGSDQISNAPKSAPPYNMNNNNNNSNIAKKDLFTFLPLGSNNNNNRPSTSGLIAAKVAHKEFLSKPKTTAISPTPLSRHKGSFDVTPTKQLPEGENRLQKTSHGIFKFGSPSLPLKPKISRSSHSKQHSPTDESQQDMDVDSGETSSSQATIPDNSIPGIRVINYRPLTGGSNNNTLTAADVTPATQVTLTTLRSGQPTTSKASTSGGRNKAKAKTSTTSTHMVTEL